MATLIGRRGPDVRQHVEVGCKNESEIVQTLFLITVEKTAVAWALILKPENVMPCPVQVTTPYIRNWFFGFSGILAFSQVTGLSFDGNKNENTLFCSSQLMEASQTGHRLLSVQRLVVVARSFGPEIVAIPLRSLVASHATILEETKSRENVTRCSARVCISVKNTFDFDFH